MTGPNKSKENIPVLLDRIIKRIREHKTCEGFTDNQLYLVIDEAMKLFTPLSALIEIEPPVTIFGDIHGQLNDLLRFADIVGEPPSVQWLMLGDYVDRCKKGLEVMMLLLCIKIKYPSRVHLLRGNHECQKTNRIYGFYAEMKVKRTTKMWLAFNKLFNEFPLCASISRKILCMHGGISQKIIDWKSLEDLKKPKTIVECDEGIALDLLWADPTNDACDFRFNQMRYTSVVFGDIAIKEFTKRLNISMIVRAHEAVQEGHNVMSGSRLVTIFSAPNYCGNDGNCASVMHVSPHFKVNFTTLKPRLDHANITKEMLEQLQRYSEVKSPNVQPGRHLANSPLPTPKKSDEIMSAKSPIAPRTPHFGTSPSDSNVSTPSK